MNIMGYIYHRIIDNYNLQLIPRGGGRNWRMYLVPLPFPVRMMPRVQMERMMVNCLL